MSGPGKKMITGLESALAHAKVQNAVRDWVAFELPQAVQSHVTPEMVARLVDNICGSSTTVVALTPKRDQ